MTQADIDLILAGVGFPKGEVIPIPCGNCESLRGTKMKIRSGYKDQQNFPRPDGKRYEDCIILHGYTETYIEQFYKDYDLAEGGAVCVFASLEESFFPMVSRGVLAATGILRGYEGLIVFTSPEYVIIENPSLESVGEKLLKAEEQEREAAAKREHINRAVAQWHATQRKEAIL